MLWALLFLCSVAARGQAGLDLGEWSSNASWRCLHPSGPQPFTPLCLVSLALRPALAKESLLATPSLSFRQVFSAADLTLLIGWLRSVDMVIEVRGTG